MMNGASEDTLRRFGLASASMLAMACAAWSGTAAAQATSESRDRATHSGSGIADIIVTAQRRSESLQDVPLAVSAVTSETLTEQGITNTQELSQNVPSLTAVQTAGYFLPRIRGVGNDVVGAGYESGVATYVDGIYLASAPSSLFSLNNIERVEVLKGPQGTLFGRNSTGGLIQVITREPSAAPGGDVRISYGNYDTLVADGYVTAGLSDTVAMDLAGHVSTQGDGYGTNRLSGRDVNRLDFDLALRGSLLFSPGERTTVRLIGDYSENHGSAFDSVRLAPGTGSFFPQAPFESDWDVESDVEPVTRFSGWGVSLKIDQEFDFARVTSISGYRKSHAFLEFDQDGTFVPSLVLTLSQRDRQFSQELQVGSHADARIQWIVGLYYFGNKSSFDPTGFSVFGAARDSLGGLSAIETFATLNTDALAGYAQVTAPIAADTNLTLGFRYTTEKRQISATDYLGFFGGPLNTVIPYPDLSDRFSEPTWRISIDHRFSPSLMAYASYNRGFKSGGFNGQAPTEPAYRPEKIDAFEVGLKSDLLDRRLRLNASAFYYDYKDIQVLRYVLATTSIYYGAAARVYGAELEFEARPVPNLRLSGGITWVHDRFTDFPQALFADQGPFGVIVRDCTPTQGNPLPCSAEGNRLPRTADLTASIMGDYVIPTSFGQIGINASYSYNDGYYSQVDNILRQPSYGLLAASLRFEVDDSWTFRIWGRNLTNEAVAQTLAAGQANSIVSYGPPRTYGVSVERRF